MFLLFCKSINVLNLNKVSVSSSNFRQKIFILLIAKHLNISTRNFTDELNILTTMQNRVRVRGIFIDVINKKNKLNILFMYSLVTFFSFCRKFILQIIFCRYTYFFSFGF